MLRPIMDVCPCESCMAKDSLWAIERCRELGACWLTEPNILDEIMSSVGVGCWELHHPPVFIVRAKKDRGESIVEEFKWKPQELNRVGRLVKEMYEIAIKIKMSDRLRSIGFLEG